MYSTLPLEIGKKKITPKTPIFSFTSKLNKPKKARISPIGPHVSNDIEIAVIVLRFKSLKKHQNAIIRERLNILLSTIADNYKRYEEHGTVENYYGGRNKLKFDPTEAQNLKRIVRCTAEA